MQSHSVKLSADNLCVSPVRGHEGQIQHSMGFRKQALHAIPRIQDSKVIKHESFHELTEGMPRII